MIEIARNFLPLFGLRYDGYPLLQPPRLMLCFARHEGKVTRGVRSKKASALAPIAIQGTLCRKRTQVRNGCTAFLANRISALLTVDPTQRLERRLDAVSDLAAVTARATRTYRTCVEHQRAASRRRSLARSRKARIPGTDHEHVHLGGHRLLGQHRRHRGYLPQRRRKNRG